MRRHVVIAVFALLPACFDVAFEEGDDIACSREDECPRGSFCALSVGRCIADAARDEKAPALDDVSLFPAVAAAGDVVTLAFTASEPLARPPAARVVTGDGADARAFVL